MMLTQARADLAVCLGHCKTMLRDVFEPLSSPAHAGETQASTGAFVRASAVLGAGMLVQTASGKAAAAVSPLGLSAAVAVAAAAADGETRSVLEGAAMGSGGGDPASALKHLLAAIDKEAANAARWSPPPEDAPPRGLLMATYVACRESLPVKGSFRDVLDMIGTRTFTLPDVPEEFDPVELNGWISDRTSGLIPKMLPPVKPDVRGMLGSTLFYARDWLNRFETEDTVPGVFTASSGRTATVPMMRSGGKMDYARSPGAESVRLDLGHSAEVILVIPSSEPGGDIRPEEPTPGYVCVPRVTLEMQIDIKLALEGLGLGAIFSVEGDLTRMSPEEGVHFGSATQKLVLKMDEYGVLGAAVTNFDMLAGAGMPRRQPKPFITVFNRPFLMVVRERATGVIPFVAWVSETGTEEAARAVSLVPERIAAWLRSEGVEVPAV